MQKEKYLPTHELDRMLQFLRLDKYYESGHGDWLTYTNENGKRIQVLDMVGSYGINLLGHNNKVVQKLLSSFSVPCFVQASRMPDKILLSQKITGLTEKHTGLTGWHVEYANSGSEIIEVALKLCWLHYKRKMDRIRQEMYYSINYLEHKKADACELRCFTAQLSILDAAPLIAHVEGSFHGKTLGALSVMSNAQLKNNFPVALEALTLSKDAEALCKDLEEKAVTYRIIDEKTGGVITKKYLPLIGLLIEPIQGEAGVILLDDNLLSKINELKHSWDLPVVSDEIQCGLYRTGCFSCLDNEVLTADIYCFGKALGAGIAKLSALCCSDKIYSRDFFQYHSSSFAGDAFSCRAGLLFLESFEENNIIRSIHENWVLKQLSALENIFPEYVRDVRGKGLMCAIELDGDALNNSFITKFLKDIGMLGYWVASIMLNREHIRILPTLSNPLSFRIQPSVQFSKDDLLYLFNGFARLFDAIERRDLNYLFGHILNVSGNAVLKSLPDDVKNDEFPKNAAVFICHPIDNPHICQIIDLLDGYDDRELTTMLEDLSMYQKFTVYHTDKLTDSGGNTIPIVYLGIPLTSLSFFHLLRWDDRYRYEWIQKIQEAVNLANDKKAKSIGLGQFTSIITKNGMHLYSPNATLTTGNTYTAKLAMQAAFRQYQEKNVDDTPPAVCLLGARGNIISSIAEEMIDHAGKLVLVYRHPLEKDNDTWHHFRELLSKVAGSGSLTKKIQALLRSTDINTGFKKFVARLCDDIVVTHSLCHKEVGNADIIFAGTNDTGTLLLPGHIKKGAIVVDISIPSNVSPVIQSCSDYTYIKGGMAALPEYAGMIQSLDSVILPFGKGECFACMAETFGLAFAAPWSANLTGDISTEKMKIVSQMMDKAGFGLKRAKVESSL